MKRSIAVALTVLFGVLAAPAAAHAAPNTGLSFGPCPADVEVAPGSGTECAVVSVPMDYSAPSGRQIDVTVSRIAAAADRRGAIFVNPGGPGGDALSFWGRHAADMPADLRAHYDQFAVQPRGLRWSTPLECGADSTVGARNSLRANCERAQPGYVQTITTENTARDMDAVRAELGLDRISFLGVSYGTYLGAVYASQFPERVDRLILDSNVNPQWVWTELFAQQQVAAKGRYEDLFGWIAANNATYGLGDSPLRVFESWTSLVVNEGGGWYANLTPPSVTGADLPTFFSEPLAAIARQGFDSSVEQIAKVQNLMRAVTFGTASPNTPLLGATGVATYSRKFWPLLAQAMADVKADPTNTQPLLAIGDRTTSDPTSTYVLSAITCNENANPARPDLISAALSTIASGGNAMDARADLVRTGVACSGWPAVTKPVHIADHGLATPPLILQSRHDAKTKFDGGPAMAAALGGSLITVEGGDHGVFGRRNPQVDDAVLAYLNTGRVTTDHADEAPLPAPPVG